MASYQATLDALVNPGNASQYFDQSAFGGRLAPLDPDSPGYSPGNTWWLMELSRLIYNMTEDVRQSALQEVHLKEVLFVDDPHVQYSIISPTDPARQFAVVVFRGTHDPTDVVTDIEIGLGEWEGPGFVHRGFQEALDEVWPDLRSKLKEPPFQGIPVLFTGHSLGAALATLSAARRLVEGQHSLSVTTFGSPRVGTGSFVDFLGSVPIYRIVDGRDVIPRVPLFLGYRHVGELHPVPSGYRHEGMAIEELALLKFPLEGRWEAWMSFQKAVSPLPEFLSDHAPINYLADLEMQIQR